MTANNNRLWLVFPQPWFVLSFMGLAFCLATRQTAYSFPSSALSNAPLILLPLSRAITLLLLIVLIALFSFKKSRFTVAKLFRHPVVILGATILAIGGLWTITRMVAPFVFFGYISFGIANSLLLIVWVAFLFSSDKCSGSISLFALVVAIFMSAIIQVFNAILPEEASMIIILFFPLASCLCYFFSNRRISCELPEEQKTDSKTGTPSCIKEAFLSRFSSLIFVLGIIGYSMIFNMLASGRPSDPDIMPLSAVYEVAIAVSNLLAALLIYQGCKVIKPSEPCSPFSLFLPLTVFVSLYFSTLLSSFWVFFYIIPTFIARRFLLFLIWNNAIGRENFLKRIKTFIVGIFAIEFGYTLCELLRMYIVNTGNDVQQVASILTAVILGFIFVKETLTWIISQKNQVQTVAAIKKNSETTIDTGQICSKMACLYGLTSREKDVLLLLVKGRNADFIGKTLVIENSTAKRHIANIYKKTNVNSQQLLIDLFDEMIQQESTNKIS